ncbi:MAG: glycosyltransferase [Planctomycetota bacterium]
METGAHTEHRLLVASASAGAGHARAAAALKRAFDLAGHAGSAETLDVLQYMTSFFRKIYLRSYFSVISALPWYWRFLYHRWDRKPINGFERRSMCFLDRLNAGKFISLVAERRPTHIACTHFLPAEILAWMRRTGRLDVPVGVVVTDYDAHRIWMHEGIDQYFVASDYLRGLLINKGAPPDKVMTCGIPIDPVFSGPMDRAAARAELALDPDMPTVLTIGGGDGMGGMKKTVRALDGCGRLQILAVTGHNEKLKQWLDASPVSGSTKLVTYGFVDYIQTLMAAADLIVTKPGGMSTTECLAVGLPMVLTVPIPGQEEKNSAFLVGRGAALPAANATDLRKIVGELFADTARLGRMRDAALEAARPRAAFDIVDAVLKLGAS